MPHVIIRLEGYAGHPTLKVGMTDGKVEGLDAILPHVRNDGNAVSLVELLHQLATAFEKSANYSGACEVYRAVLQVTSTAGRTLDGAVCLNNLGLALKMDGHLDQALASYQEALVQLRTPLLSADDDETRVLRLAHVLLNLAVIWYERGKVDEVRKYATWARAAIEYSHDPAAGKLRQEIERLVGR